MSDSTRTDETDRLCTQAWDRAVDCYGTGKMFLDRANKYRRWLNCLTYLGIAVPALVGGIALTYGINSDYLPLAVTTAGGVGLVQLLVSIASIVDSWPDRLEYSNESGAENLSLAEEFKELGASAPHPPSNPYVQYQILVNKDEVRKRQDAKRGVKPYELRNAHRQGLRWLQRQCAGCGKVPTDMQSTDCGVCGRFKWIKKWSS